MDAGGTIEQTVQELAVIGKTISQQPQFNYDHLEEACRLFWPLLIDQPLEFTQDKVQIIPVARVEAEMLISKVLTWSRLHALLPAKVKKRYTIKDLQAAYERTLDGVLEAVRGISAYSVGHYSRDLDICYVAEADPVLQWKNPVQEQTTTALHELTHRYCHVRRKELFGDQTETLFECGVQEERFCGKVEHAFCYCLWNYHALKSPQEDVAFLRREIDQLQNPLFDEPNLQRNTRELVDHYTSLLSNQRKHKKHRRK